MRRARDLVWRPVLGSDLVQPFGIGLNDGCIDPEGFTANKLFSDTARQYDLKEMPNQIVIAKPAPLGVVLRKRLPGNAWRFFENVEWSEIGSVRSRRRNHRYAKFM